MHQSTLERVNLALWAQNIKCGTPTLSCIFLLYPFNTDINVFIQNPPHHWDITILCQSSSYNALMTLWSVLVGMSAHAPGQLSSGSCSEQRCQSGCSNPHFMKAEMVVPGTYCETLPQVPWCMPVLGQPVYILLKTCQKYKLQYYNRNV